jgi:hypothetical protein
MGADCLNTLEIFRNRYCSLELTTDSNKFSLPTIIRVTNTLQLKIGFRKLIFRITVCPKKNSMKYGVKLCYTKIGNQIRLI